MSKPARIFIQTPSPARAKASRAHANGTQSNKVPLYPGAMTISRQSLSTGRRHFDCDFHRQMVGRAAEPATLQGDRLARIVDHSDAHQILIADGAARRVEIDPAGTRHKDLRPGVGIAAVEHGLLAVVVTGQIKIAGNKTGGEAEMAK